MGCGSSSLKGEKVDTVGGAGGGSNDLGPPAKKVKTNFSDVDFSSNASADRRGTMAVAPDEHRRPTKVSEVSAEGATGLSRPHSKSNVEPAREEEGAPLQPYRSNDTGMNGLAEPMDQKIEALQPNKAQDMTPEVALDTQPRTVGDATR